MTNSTICRPTVKEVSDFLSEYAVQLFGSGATCIRMEKNMHRIARSQDMEASFSILPRHIHLTVTGHDNTVTSVVAILPCIRGPVQDSPYTGRQSVAVACACVAGQCIVLPSVWRRHGGDGDSVRGHVCRISCKADAYGETCRFSADCSGLFFCVGCIGFVRCVVLAWRHA